MPGLHGRDLQGHPLLQLRHEEGALCQAEVLQARLEVRLPAAGFQSDRALQLSRYSQAFHWLSGRE